MKCPICSNVDLLMTERQTVEIDYCPQCRGIWLDRGELEKIIERSISVNQQFGMAGGKPYREDDDDDHDEHRGFGKQGNHNRRRGFLGELFDF